VLACVSVRDGAVRLMRGLVTAGRAVRQERFCWSSTGAEVHALLSALDQVFGVAVESVRAHLEEQRSAWVHGPRGRGDNAAMESFFALLQENVLGPQRWDTADELRLAMVTWIERNRSAHLGGGEHDNRVHERLQGVPLRWDDQQVALATVPSGAVRAQQHAPAEHDG